MATFKTRIEDLAGTIPATADGEQFLKDGVVDVIQRIVTANPEHIPLFCKEVSIVDSGTTVDDIHVVEVNRSSKSCREILATGRHAAVDTASLFYASEDDPVYFFLNEKIFVKPTGSSPTMSILDHGTVNNWDSGTSSIDNMPEHHYQQIIMYAAIQLLNHKIAVFGDEEDVEMMASTTQNLAALQQQYIASFIVTGQQ